MALPEGLLSHHFCATTEHCHHCFAPSTIIGKKSNGQKYMLRIFLFLSSYITGLLTCICLELTASKRFSKISGSTGSYWCLGFVY